MRGIAGFFHFGGETAAEDHGRRMLRGMALTSTPERMEFWHREGAALGHVAHHEPAELVPDQQPLTTRNGGVMVTVAYLQNRAALAAAFGWSSTEASAKSDSGFVLAAFERWGEACPVHLEGIFSLAVWLPRAQRFFCAVNRRAIHPIYYWRQGNQFAFASTLSGLFALPAVSRRLNVGIFAEQFANLPADSAETLYTDVSRVRNAHGLVVDAREVRAQRYWTPSPPAVVRLRTDADYVDAMRAHLTAAVRSSLRPVPGNVGLLLSGGLDSSAVAVTAGGLLAAEGRRLQAIHLVPAPGNRYHDPNLELDESGYVRHLQAHAPHIDFHFTPANSTPVPRAAWDDYFADNCAPFASILARDPAFDAAVERLNISQLLDGTGGNHVVSLEAFPSGYLSHLAVSGRWLAWWREARGHSRVYSRSFRFLARHTAIDPIKRLLRRKPPPPPARAVQWLHPDLRARTGIDERLRATFDFWHRPQVAFRRHLHGMVNVWAGLRVGTPPSVFARRPVHWIVRQPLFDRALNEFCLSVPFDQQVRDGWDRRLLREAMRGLLPEEVRLRKLRGFPQPEFQRNFTLAQPMLREELERMGSSALVRELLDYDRVVALWRRREAEPGFRHELVLAKCIGTGAFLRWHERHGA